MSARLPWIQRKFSFDYPVEIWPEIVERFRGTPARIDSMIAGLPPQILTRRDEQTWSMQENIGHLLDLEPLLGHRIDEFLAGRETLSAADMKNRATYEAGHNERLIADLLTDLRHERDRLIARIEALKDEDFARVSVHPRLQIKMRLVDSIKFACDHDDYHLARISELIRMFKG
jgi:uncharacterized damage-inducible protein DinB